MMLKDFLRMFEKVGFTWGRELKESFPIKGRVVCELFGPDGKLKDSWTKYNTVTELGDALTADYVSDRGEAQVGYLGIGTTAGGKSTASVALQAQVARVAVDSRTQGTGADDNKVVWVATFPAGTGTGTIVEAGLFTGSTGDNLYSWLEFAAKAKGAADALQITWTIKYGASGSL